MKFWFVFRATKAQDEAHKNYILNKIIVNANWRIFPQTFASHLIFFSVSLQQGYMKR